MQRVPSSSWSSRAWCLVAVAALAGCANNYAPDEDGDGGAHGARNCAGDQDCGAGERCHSSVCVATTGCTDNSQCPPGQSCLNGICLTGCDDHFDCAVTEHCEDRTCQPGGPCNTDDNCRDSQICGAQGWCIDGCRANDGCPQGQICTDNRCQPCTSHEQCDQGEICRDGACAPGCRSAAECQEGQVCRDGTCAACTANEECAAGHVCISGVCTATTACNNDTDCALTEHCEDNYCVSNAACADSSECPSTQSCVNGACTRNDPCNGTADCSPTQTCVNGTCSNNPACASNANCASNQTCVGGACTNNPTCSVDGECPDAQSCVNGWCTHNPSCTNDVDCPVTQSCENGTCTRNPACTRDVDCPAGYHCDSSTCTRNPSCSSDSECPVYQSCVDGLCTDNPPCGTSADCPASQYCEAGQCVQGPQCTSDAECLVTEQCVSGRCETNPSCTLNRDCPIEQHCEAGTCARNPSCTEDIQCGAGFACINGTCTQVAGCGTDADCQDTTLCNGAERCDLNTGVCYPGAPVQLDDNVPCTEDTCDPATGAVTHNALVTRCEDNNPCTLDTCDPILDCLHDADPAAVPPQSAVGDCQRDVCQGTTKMKVVDDTDTPVSDGISCTIETCTDGLPSTSLDSVQCQDNTVCNGEERCVSTLGCRPPVTPFTCPEVDSCHVGFCDPVTGCGSNLVDRDDDGHVPTTCGGDDCNDNAAEAYTGHAEVPGDNIDNDCNTYVDEGAGTLSCPAAPVGKRILDEVILAANIQNVVAGTYSVRWTVTAEPQAGSLALSGATTATVRFTPVVRGDYTLRVTLTQLNSPNQTCDVSFTVAGPDEDFNAQLQMSDAVDLDLHVMHPVGRADPNGYFYDFNWGPMNAYSCYDWFFGYYTCPTEEAIRAEPDCHYENCAACTVPVPGQPPCASRSLRWDQEGGYEFLGGASATTDAIPKLDIDNRRGCYSDSLGNRVCTPENISIKRPSARTGRYTVAVHYWGEPVVQSGTTYGANQRGVPPPGLGSVSFEVELYCKGVGFKRYRCNNVPVDGWCFVGDAVWNGSQCTGFATPTRQFTPAIISGSGVDAPAYFDTAGPPNVVATALN